MILETTTWKILKEEKETHTHTILLLVEILENNGITKHEKTSKIQKKKNPHLTRSKLTTKKERERKSRNKQNLLDSRLITKITEIF